MPDFAYYQQSDIPWYIKVQQQRDKLKNSIRERELEQQQEAKRKEEQEEMAKQVEEKLEDVLGKLWGDLV